MRRYGISFWTSRDAINKVDNRAFSITDRRLIVLWTGTMLIRFWKIISLDFNTNANILFFFSFLFVKSWFFFFFSFLTFKLNI